MAHQQLINEMHKAFSDMSSDKRIRDVVCPQCKREFRLVWNDYKDDPSTLRVRSCPSGGVYDVSVCCPHCDYEEEL